MAAIAIYLGAAWVITVILVAVGARYRRYDRVPQPRAMPGNRVGSMRGDATVLATPEQVTSEQVRRSQVYDGVDDLLDRSHPRHREWVANHQGAEADPPSDESGDAAS